MLTLFHDFTSPASAVAVARLRRLATDGVRARLVGTEVLSLEVPLPVTVDLLAELDAVRSAAAAEGLELRRPPLVPPTALAHLVGDVAADHGVADAWRAQCYTAFWTEGLNIGDVEVLRRLADRVGLSGSAVTAAVTDRVALLAIRRRFAGHRRDGVGGVPTISYDRTLVPGLLDDADLLALAALAAPDT